MKSIISLSQILIFAKEIEQTSVLYSVCFGLKIKLMSDSYLELQDARNFKICFYKVNNFAQQTKGYSPILVFKVNEFEETLNKLLHYGANQEGIIQEQNNQKVNSFLQGLNGEMISLMQSNLEEQSDDENDDDKQQTEIEKEIQQMLRKIKL